MGILLLDKYAGYLYNQEKYAGFLLILHRKNAENKRICFVLHERGKR
jgi:hypothetical protein